MNRSLLALAVAASLACGGHGPSPQPSPPDTGGGNPGGNPGGGGGGGGGGGSPPGGGGGGGGGGATPEPSDPTVTIRRLDDSPECDGLIPSHAPPAVSADVAADHGSCGPGISEGGGHVAVVSQLGRGFQDFQVFSPDGKPERSFRAATFTFGCFVAAMCSPVFPQEDGFMAGSTTGGTGSHDPLIVQVRTFGADGSLRRTVTPTTPEMGIERWSLHEDPRGGVLLVADGEVPPDLPGAGTCSGHTFRFGPDGGQRSHTDLACRLFGAGVSTLGESLVVESSDGRPGSDRFHVFYQWQQPDGTFSRDATSELAPFTFDPHFAPLLLGGLAMNDGGNWTKRFAHLAAASEPAPDWLAAKGGWTFRFTRGNQGYALFPPPGQQLVGCDPGVEIRSVNGLLCGTITFREEGGACRTGVLDQGWDGTVVQQSGRSSCHYRWWPRLLAKE